MNVVPAHNFGLIGCSSPSTIDHATPISATLPGEFEDFPEKNCDLKHTVEQWALQGSKPCGVYFVSEGGESPDASNLLRLESYFLELFPEQSGMPVIHMPLMLGTAGCLEAFTYILENGSLRPVPLVLKEDGQGSQKS